MSASFEKAAKKEVSYADLLDELLATEVSSMAQKHHQMRIAMARFPLQKTLEGFDFKSQTSIDSKLVRELATGRYMRSGDTVISRAARNGERPFAILVAPSPVGQRSHLPAEPRPKANQADSSRSRCARHDLLVIDDALDGDPNLFPSQFLERALSLPPAPGYHLPERHLVYQLRDTTTALA